MSVTDNLPSKVGQRVQDVFTDSRGWVRELGERHGVKVARIAWDAPELELGEDDSVFPIDALRVVEVIQLDVDHFADPGRSPLVEMVSLADSAPDLSCARYRFANGAVAVGVDAARYELLKQSATGWDD